jgi:serine/threonine protein phosphatase 1
MITTYGAAGIKSPGRTIAIGDIHGCSIALNSLLAEIAPTPDDTLVTLGDYIDRGPDSKGVLDTLVGLRKQCRLVPMLGNHEAMLFCARASHSMLDQWLRFGGQATLDSFGSQSLDGIPDVCWSLLESCRLCYETANHFFVHANYDPARPLGEQPEDTALCLSLVESVPGPHCSGKTAVVGHTVQPSGDVLDLGHLLCIDTDCCHGGYLTALDVDSGEIWQARDQRPSAARPLGQPNIRHRMEWLARVVSRKTCG